MISSISRSRIVDGATVIAEARLDCLADGGLQLCDTSEFGVAEAFAAYISLRLGFPMDARRSSAAEMAVLQS
jgi:hypothetical protein